MATTLKGSGVSPGTGHAAAHLLIGAIPVPAENLQHAGDAAAEKARVAAALEEVAADLESRGERAGGEAAEVLSAQAMMARDPGLADGVDELVDGGVSGEGPCTRPSGPTATCSPPPGMTSANASPTSTTSATAPSPG